MPYRDVVHLTTAFEYSAALVGRVAASDTTAVHLGPGDMEAVAAAFVTREPYVRARTITVTLAAEAGAYRTDVAIQLGAKRADGVVERVDLTPTSADGGETLETPGGYVALDWVYIPTQVTAAGAFEFGLGALVFSPHVSLLVATTAGTYKYRTQEGIDRDVTHTAAERVEVNIERLRREHATFPCTLYQDVG